MTRPLEERESGARKRAAGRAKKASPPGRARRALVCAPLMPEFDRESGSSRVWAFVLFLRDAGWQVTFVSRQSLGRPDRYLRLLEEAGVAARPAHGDDLSDLLQAERFDLALLAFWRIGELYAPQIRAWSPHTKIIVDSIDLHFVREARQAFVQPANGARPGLLHASGEEIVRELNTYAAADAVLTVSEQEASFLNTMLGDQANARDVPDCEDLPLSQRPFEQRQGLVFVGNFRHAPNVDAVQFLCQDIVPRLPPKLLESHPLFIVGNEVNDEVRRAVEGLKNVRLVGWVPSLIPYLDRVRVALVPLRYGAGTKRKLLQSLMLGTPSVSSTVGIEGMGLEDGEHVLVADAPQQFAAGIARLLEDQALWQRLVSSGRLHVMATHSRDGARRAFAAVVEAALSARGNRARLADERVDARWRHAADEYDALVARLRAIVSATLPPGASVLVVSKGDQALLDLDGRRAWHFPRTETGEYAGHYPRDGADAVAQLEAGCQRGAEYFVLPATALWWLDYYTELREHLDERYRLICDRRETCLIFALAASAADQHRTGPLTAARQPPTLSPLAALIGHARSKAPEPVALEELRPQIVPLPRALPGSSRSRAERVLVIGIYLADQRNTVEDSVARLSESQRWRVQQRWIALGGGPPSPSVEAVTVSRVHTRIPKFQLVNDLLAKEDLGRYEYVLLVDDDVVFPRGFMDHFLSLQRCFDLALAQPARTSRSFIDHPIVEQQLGSLARLTLFVEVGPVVSFHRSIFNLVFPFDLTSPMGWGYENVWSAELTRRKLSMGIIDAVPIDHSVRPPVSHYNWDDADEGRTALLRKHRAPSTEECVRVLRVFTASGMAHA